MSDEKRAQVEQILTDAQVKFSVKYRGETTRDDDWKCDEWACTFEAQTRSNPAKPYQSEKFEFYTGLGLRHPVDVVSRGHQSKMNPRSIAWHEIEKTRKPKAPHAADVLYSVISDSSACEMSFSDWCAEFGYDTDSRKALATYEACQQNADKLKRIFTRDQIEQIRAALEDY